MTIKAAPDNKVIIDAQKSGFIFNIGSGYTVNITGITFINGNNSDYGGAIYNRGDLTITNSTFSNNTVNALNSAWGGAIYHENGNLIIINSIFTYNNCVATGGNGGAIYFQSGNLNISNSSFSHNSANAGVGGSGGAISQWDGNSLISNCNFFNNSASSGGAVSYRTGLMNISNSNFTNNSARSTGGAISHTSYNGLLTISNSNFKDNNVSSGSGGAIHQNNAGPIEIINCNFTNNSASSIGGAIYQAAGTMNISISTFEDNMATDGGAIYKSDGAYIGINNSLFVNNSAKSNGGAIYDNGRMNITNSYFKNNTAINGGAIYFNYGNMNISNSNFTNNSASNHGGAIYEKASYSESGILTNLLSIGNIYSYNTAVGSGGGIYFDNGNITVDNDTFANNTANTGGAFYQSRGNITINSSKFTGNFALLNGAGIYVNGNMTILKSNFTYNNATNNGGAIYLNTGILNAFDSIFDGNIATIKGAGICNVGGNLTVNNGTFRNHNSNNAAIYNDYNAIVNNSKFESNYGGINNYENLTVVNSAFDNNYYALWLNGTIDSIKDSNVTNSIYSGFIIFNNKSSLINNDILKNNIAILIGYNDTTVDIPSVFWNYNTIKENNYIFAINGSRNTLNYGVLSNNINGILVNGVSNTFYNITLVKLNNTALIFNESSKNNLFNRGNILDNGGIAVIMNGTNDTVLSSTIYNNTGVGFLVSGKNNTVNYNRIYKNNGSMNRITDGGMINNGLNTNANLNWWGVNNAPTQVVNNDPSFKMATWYVLELSANDFKTIVNASKNYTIDDILNVIMSYRLTTNINTIHDKNMLPYFEVIVKDQDGTIHYDGDIRTSDVSYLVKVREGEEYYINALSDDENVILKISGQKNNPINPTPTPVPTPNPNPIPAPNPNPTPTPEPNENNKNNSNLTKVSATMKKTGIPANLILIAFLSVLGILIGRKQN